MRKTVNFLITAVVLAGIYFLLKSYFPKYALFLPYFLITLFLDLYLWYSIKNAIGSRKRAFRYLLTGLYWLPLFVFLLVILVGFLKPFIYWNIFLRTYLIASIGIVYICKLFPIFFLFLTDLIRLIRFVYRLITGKRGSQISADEAQISAEDGRRISVKNIILSTGWVLGTAFFMLLLSGMILWNYNFKVRQHTIHLPELPVSFNGIRIVQISDLHLGNWACPGKLEKAVNAINDLHPDVLFFTGDLVNYTSYEAYNFAQILKGIKAPLGKFAIMGNHDYGDYVSWSTPEGKKKNLDYLHYIYEYMGWRLLRNEHAILRNGNDSIAVIGVENWGGTRRFPRLGDIEKATNGIRNMSVQLLLSHDPSHWEKVVRHKYKEIDITFSGHTHGFQFGVECCGIQWSPFRNIYENWAGLYSEPVPGSHPQYLYINRGLGSIAYPGRIGILPEITLIVLKR